MMRLSREKIVRLSHQITEVLVSSDEVDFIDDRDTIRQQIVQILTAMLRDEEKIELEVRKRRVGRAAQEVLSGRTAPPGYRCRPRRSSPAVRESSVISSKLK